MPRAYLRLDPAFDEHKAHYPDGPYSALVATLCLAEHQPQRGRFRNVTYLKALLGRRGRHVPYLIAQQDLTELPDGRLYVEGWDEWQEGDWKVAERVARIRDRRRNGRPAPDGNGAGNGPRNDGGNGAERYSPLERSGGTSGSGASAASRAEQAARAVLPGDDAPEWEAIVWLANHGCYLQPHSGYYRAVVLAVEQHGVNAFVGMLDRLAAAGMHNGDAKGFVFGAKDALDAQTRPSLKALETEDRAEEREDSWSRRTAATKVRAHELGMHLEPNPGCPSCAKVTA